MADLLLSCREGRQFVEAEHPALHALFRRRSGPIAAAIAITVEVPDSVSLDSFLHQATTCSVEPPSARQFGNEPGMLAIVRPDGSGPIRRAATSASRAAPCRGRRRSGGCRRS